MDVADCLFWPHTQKGDYTCKSGYPFLKEENDFDAPGSPVDCDKDLWREIWSLYVPNKVKNLVWRACRESLPSKANLVRQTIYH